jgi:hypothetical protein
MGLMDILEQYTQPNADAAAKSQTHFDEVARSAPPEVLGKSVADTLRSDQTPPLGEMVSQMFSRSNPQQQAGLLNQILGALGPGALSGVAGGILGRVLGGNAAPATSAPASAAQASTASVTPDQASQVTPDQVRDITAQAAQQNPGIVDQIGHFYAQHPDLVKGLGGMAVAVLLGKMANHSR